MTLEKAVADLNKTIGHANGLHISIHSMDLLPEELANNDTLHHVISQTYDFRYKNPDKKSYQMTLSSEDLQVIGKALQMYEEVMLEVHIEPKLADAIKSIAGSGALLFDEE